MNFHDKSKYKDQEIDLSFDSAHCASHIKMGAQLRAVGGGGGVCISSAWKKPMLLHYLRHLSYYATCAATPIVLLRQLGSYATCAFTLLVLLRHFCCYTTCVVMYRKIKKEDIGGAIPCCYSTPI